MNMVRTMCQYIVVQSVELVFHYTNLRSTAMVWCYIGEERMQRNTITYQRMMWDVVHLVYRVNVALWGDIPVKGSGSYGSYSVCVFVGENSALNVFYVCFVNINR